MRQLKEEWAATRWMSVSRAEWYESYRKFFYILDKKRD